MTEQNKIDYWVDIADYDLKTAEAMLETGRFLYVGNIRVRYPSDKEELFRLLNKKKCKEIINQTKEFAKWIRHKL